MTSRACFKRTARDRKVNSGHMTTLCSRWAGRDEVLPRAGIE